MSSASPPFLFSIDLEDIRQLVPQAAELEDRVVQGTEPYLEFLERWGGRATFFATGDVIRRHPELVGRIASAGHEIGCHSSDHTPLDRHDPGSLRADLERWRKDAERAGLPEAVGFRAPVGSMTERTRWAYGVLREMGFRYSASVLAAPSPLYGWPEFGPDLPRRQDGLWEIPVSLTRLPGLRVPFLGGVYFRVLPFAWIRRLFRRRLADGHPAVGYLHPYDADPSQERFDFPEVGHHPLYRRMMYWNRHRVVPRLDALMRASRAPIMPYREYVETVLEGGA